MASASRTRSNKKRGESAHRQRPSCYVLLTKRVKREPEPTTRRTRSQSAAEQEEEEQVEPAGPVRVKATRKGKGKVKAVPKKESTPPTEVEDDSARTPTQALSPTPVPGPSALTALASSSRKPPPPPRRSRPGKPAVSFEEARDESRMTTPDEGRDTANAAGSASEPFVPLLLHDTDNPVLEDMDEPEMDVDMRMGPPGARSGGNWTIKSKAKSARRSSPPPAMPRDYPFADPSSARKSPPPRAHPRRIGKPPMPDSSEGEGEGEGGDTEPAMSESEYRVNVTLGSAQYERTMELSTPVRPHAGRHEPPPPPQPPSEAGTPRIPPNFRREDTASPKQHQQAPWSTQMSHRKLIAEASLRRRQQQQQQQPVSPLPPSSEPTETPSAASERVVQDTSFHNLSHDAFWPGDDALYAGSDPGDHYPDEDGEGEDKENVHAHAHSEVVDVLGVGRTLAPSESFETPQKPRRYNIRPPATQNAQDEATAALFAPDMSDESGVSNILDYGSVARRRAEEEERRRRARDSDEFGFGFGAEEGAYVPIEGDDGGEFMLPEPPSDDSIMGYDGYSPAQGGSDKENQIDAGFDENFDPHDDDGEDDPATPTARDAHGLPEPDNRGILQPRAGEGVYTSPARHRGGAEDDPFGILATEALLRARRAYSSAMKPAPKTSAAAAASIARAEAARAGASASKPKPSGSRVLARSASGRTLADPSPAKRIPFGQRSFQDLNPPTPSERNRFADLDLPPSSPPHDEGLGGVGSPARSAATHDSIEDLYATPPSERGGFALVLSTPVRAPRVAEAQVPSDDNSIPGFASSPVQARTPRKDEQRTPRKNRDGERTPMTPRNGPRDRGSVTMRRHKSHGGVGENEEYDGRGEFDGPREPSPSPVKARPSLTHAPEFGEGAMEEEGEETETELPKKLGGGAKGKEREVPLIEPRTKGKENTGRAKTRGRKRKSDEFDAAQEEEDPEAVTRRLEDMLPRPRVKSMSKPKPKPKVTGKKSTRPAAKKARKAIAAEEDEDSDEEDGEEVVARSSSLPGSPVKKARKRGATYAGVRARQRRRGQESTPEEVREV
ncbi:unnamed protein product [Peniophora sp. CBMAI 1063]|nr:unnamed protein product [Peniophora sp. CBMAI 1063]